MRRPTRPKIESHCERARVLNVSVNDFPVGQLRELDDIWSFEYDDKWLVNLWGFDLSPGLPRDRPLHTDG